MVNAAVKENDMVKKRGGGIPPHLCAEEFCGIGGEAENTAIVTAFAGGSWGGKRTDISS